MSGFLVGDPLAAFWLGRLAITMAGAIAASVTFLLLHHAISLRLETRLKRRLERAAEDLAPYLTGRTGASKAVARAVKTHGRWAVSTALRRARRSLAGESEHAISALLEEMGETRRLARAARRGGALRRCRAIRRLAGCGGPVARRELLWATDDRRPEIRRTASEGLLELRDPFSVRAATAAFLAESSPPASWGRAFFLRLAVYAPGELRRLIAARRLEPSLEKLALEALAETGAAGAAPLALARIRSPAGELRVAAVRLLGAIGDAQWAPLIGALLVDDPEWFVRATAARALGGLGHHHRTLETLGAALTDSHWWVRANAARSLARLGPSGMNRLARAASGEGGCARRTAMPELLRLADGATAPANNGETEAGLAVAS